MEKKTANKQTGNNGMRAALPGVALVLASVLPATLNPTPGGPTSTEIRTTTESRTSSRTAKSTLAFQPGCTLPFDAIKTDGLAVDADCTMDGNAGDKLEKRLEINAKNNFCAEGTPVPIVFEDFTSLQEAADKITDLRKQIKTSRDQLSDMITSKGGAQIGEGTLVQFVTFLFEARFSNVGKGKGELVNCKLTKKEDNDIHIELTMDPKDDDPCNGVTAEMSPHFRPEAWNELASLEIKTPVRITGPLFFDGSHHPCHDDVRPTPHRISVWEIHPVYQFEVCSAKSLKTCDVRDNSKWIPLDQFLSAGE